MSPAEPRMARDSVEIHATTSRRAWDRLRREVGRREETEEQGAAHHQGECDRGACMCRPGRGSGREQEAG